MRYFSRWALTGDSGCFKVQDMENDKTFITSTDLMNTVRLVGIGVVVNLMVTLVTLGIVWYNL